MFSGFYPEIDFPIPVSLGIFSVGVNDGNPVRPEHGRVLTKSTLALAPGGRKAVNDLGRK